MKKSILGTGLFLSAVFLTVLFVYLFDLFTKIEATATYYSSQYSDSNDDEEGLRNVLDIEFNTIDTNSIESIYLEELILNKGCNLESPDGSNVASVEENLKIKPGMYSVIKNKDRIILRFDYPDLPYKDCYNLYSGKVKIVFKGDKDPTVKRFNISKEELKNADIIKMQ